MIVARSAIINARVKRILIERACAGCDQVIAHAARCWFWEQGKNRRSLWRNPRIRDQISRESGPAGSRSTVACERVKNLTVHGTESSQILAKVAVTRFSKTTSALHQSGRNRVLIGYTLLLLRTLVVAKKEEFILNNGAADRSSKLLPRGCSQRNTRLVREGIARLLVAITIIVEAAAVQFIRTGLNGHLHRACRGFAGLGIVILQRNFCFADRVQVGIYNDNAQNRILVVRTV